MYPSEFGWLGLLLGSYRGFESWVSPGALPRPPLTSINKSTPGLTVTGIFFSIHGIRNLILTSRELVWKVRKALRPQSLEGTGRSGSRQTPILE